MKTTTEDVETSLALCVRRAIAGISREYPNVWERIPPEQRIANSPREEMPAFFGCYDWHSAVHAHWLLVRMLRVRPQAEWTGEALATLANSLSEENLEVEHRALVNRPEDFECPYGLAWLLQLDAEMANWRVPIARTWNESLAPLVGAARDRLAKWLPTLDGPNRTGEHQQTAFALGLVLDWSVTTGDEAFSRLIEVRARQLFASDRDLPLSEEPAAHDFLSPAIAEADLMRRVLPQAEFAHWFAQAIPIAALAQLQPVECPDPTNGKLAHLDGLNMSRAWMLSAIAAALGPDDSRAALLANLVARHREASRAGLASTHYAGTHWLGTFFVYGATRSPSTVIGDVRGPGGQVTKEELKEEIEDALVRRAWTAMGEKTRDAWARENPY